MSSANRPGWLVNGLLAVAENVGAAVRRARREREPRVVRVTADGRRHTLEPGARGYDRALELADEMIAVVRTESDEQ
ncbi:hypothetical protein JDY09_06870 [Thermoleophilum album]|uniref:hypothetical protein n=1 Tax=Thermoleophilum album TaxID=29539 RepID=UPI000CC09866|nr:hypothetical protein [Thermoleophilum album]MCL6439925.1 hypothetical protein [Thermoleophilum sp.]WDT93107.1 hypothetical protein JDY09_06870 [Thermoleophilum album]GBD46358.1 hypothetical protein HRbin41_01184 [bacterium HR41]